MRQIELSHTAENFLLHFFKQISWDLVVRKIMEKKLEWSLFKKNFKFSKISKKIDIYINRGGTER